MRERARDEAAGRGGGLPHSTVPQCCAWPVGHVQLPAPCTLPLACSVHTPLAHAPHCFHSQGNLLIEATTQTTGEKQMEAARALGSFAERLLPMVQLRKA